MGGCMHITTTFAEFMFAVALFVNAALFLPQAWKIFKKKKADEISLLTFGGFWVTQLLTVIHSIIRNDHILFIGYILALATCGLVILLTLRYRYLKK
jgi:MtN3 and saliva related transmembrane protein